MKNKHLVIILLITIISLFLFSLAAAHDSPNEGHVPANVNYGFEVIGRDTLAGITDGLYTDVWSHKGYAYIGTFQEPGCTAAGVFIVDIEAAIANYPALEGALVSEIKSAPNTRINDVKVHTVGDVDVLITTQEPCGMAIPGAAQSGGTAPFQVGQGGISLYDVTNPLKPKALKKNFLEFEGVHNTYEGYIIANNAGDGLINMSAGSNGIPAIPGVFVGQSTGEAIKANPGLEVSASAIFDGWGYLHIINNTGSTLNVPSKGMSNPETMAVPQLHELGYYAPAEAVEEGLGTAFGDLTMYNIEADPLTQEIVPSFNAAPRIISNQA